MTASRFAHTQVLSVREGDVDKTVTYHGSGYTYHLHKTAKDIWAKLQIARDTLKRFVKNVGVCNTTQLPGLNVCDQGPGGWYEVFVIDERKLWAVVHFLKRLNRWMLGAHVGHVKGKRHHYFVEARQFEHTPPRQVQDLRKKKLALQIVSSAIRPIPFIASSSSMLQTKMVPTVRLQQLATAVNNRFGH
jgi:hypothetical protein